MNRIRIGIALLLVLLWAGWEAQNTMARIHHPLSAAMENAAAYACAGEMRTASALAAFANNQWQQHRTLVSALADHQPLEDIEALFAQLPAAADEKAFASLCLDLSCKLRAMADAHSLAGFL